MNRATTALLLIALTIGACQPTDPQEQYERGLAYYYGRGVKQDYEQATG